MAAVKAKKPTSKLKAGQKKKTNKWLIIGGIAAVAIIGMAVVRYSSASGGDARVWKGFLTKYNCKAGGYGIPATIGQGNQGGCVKLLQYSMFVMGGTYQQNKIDGVFGSKTKAHVVAFQKKYGLKADGVVGTQTWAKIINCTGTVGHSCSFAGPK